MHSTTGLMALAFVLLWNSGFIGAEYGLPYAAPFTLLFWRYLILTILLAIGAGLARQPLWPGLRPAAVQAVIGVLAHAIWLSTVLVAIARGVPAGIVALVVALQPLATGVCSAWITGERTSPRQWLGLVTGFAGVGLTVAARMSDGGDAPIAAYLLPFAAALAMTAATLLQRRLELRDPSLQLPLTTTLLVQCAASALVLLPPALLGEALQTRWVPPFIATLAWLIVAVSLGAYGLMWQLLKRIDATGLATLFYLGPPVTMLMAWLAFRDPLRWTDGLGLILVLIAVRIARTPPASTARAASTSHP